MKKYIGYFILFGFFLIPLLSFAQESGNLGNNNSCINLTYKLRQGVKNADSNNEVSLLQNFLKNNGYFSGTIDGKFGPKTKTAVKAFQKANALKDDGVIGVNGRAKIKEISCVNKDNINIKNNDNTDNTTPPVIENQPVNNPPIINSSVNNPSNPPLVEKNNSTCPNKATKITDVRDMWVWKDNVALVTPGSQTQTDFFSFVDSHHIRNVYLSLNIDFFNNNTNVENLKDFLNIAQKEHCLGVEALSGSPEWVASFDTIKYFIAGKFNDNALKWAKIIKNFNASISEGNVKFIGLQYDVEPHVLGRTSGFIPYWGQQDSNGFSSKKADQTIENLFIDMLQKVKSTLSDSDLKLDVAIPRWLDSRSSLSSFVRSDGTTGKSVMEYVVDSADIITIMDYTTDTSSIYNDAKNELDYAANLGKKVRIGVDVGNENTSNQTTFYRFGCEGINDAFLSVYGMFDQNELKSFDSFAVHYYKYENNTPGSYSLICP